MISFLSRTIDFFFFYLSLWIYLWLADTSQQPISQTTWLKVTPHCNHCNHHGQYRQISSRSQFGFQRFLNLTRKLNEHSIRHASTPMITSYALQYNLNNKSQDAGHAGCVITSSRNKIFFLYQADGLFALVSAGTKIKASRL